MVSIGNTTLPGVSGTVESADSVSTSQSSPADVALVGAANTEGVADEAAPYRISTQFRARELFGDSPLTRNVIDALGAGAFPVYAAAAEAVDVEGESVTSTGSSGTFDTAPVSADSDDYSWSVDGGDLTTIITYDDPSEKTVTDGEVYVNPESGEYEMASSSASGDTVDYVAYDYEAAIEAMADEYGSVVDFVTPVTDNADVVDAAHAVVKEMESGRDFAMVLGSAGSYLDAGSYENPYDSSRIQLVYCPRDPDGRSLMGAYAGHRAAIGVSRSVMQTNIAGYTRTLRSLSYSEKVSLDEANVVALSSDSQGVFVENDPTCVTDENADEQAFADGLSRLVADYASDVIFNAGSQYIGGYHNPATLNNLRATIRSRLKALNTLGIVLGYNVEVEMIDAYTARVEVGVETVRPLRNIVFAVTAGDVGSGVAEA